MKCNTIKDLFESGAKLVSHDREATFDHVGFLEGISSTWIYELPDGTFWKIYQPDFYSPDMVVSQVERFVVTEVVEFREPPVEQ